MQFLHHIFNVSALLHGRRTQAGDDTDQWRDQWNADISQGNFISRLFDVSESIRISAYQTPENHSSSLWNRLMDITAITRTNVLCVNAPQYRAVCTALAVTATQRYTCIYLSREQSTMQCECVGFNRAGGSTLRTPRLGGSHMLRGLMLRDLALLLVNRPKTYIFLVNVPYQKHFSAQNALNIVWRPGFARTL